MINGGFFVLSPKVIDYIEDDETVWEQEPLIKLAEDGELSSFEHHGFWQPMGYPQRQGSPGRTLAVR